jgi:hypothetical protein
MSLHQNYYFQHKETHRKKRIISFTQFADPSSVRITHPHNFRSRAASISKSPTHHKGRHWRFPPHQSPSSTRPL